MSLDVYLKGPDKKITCFNCNQEYNDNEDLYWANITHNLTKMADEAGIYQHLWSPEKVGCFKGGDLIKWLKLGLSDLKSRPEHFKQFNSENGWGMYKHFVPFVEKYLEACIDYPDAKIFISK